MQSGSVDAATPESISILEMLTQAVQCTHGCRVMEKDLANAGVSVWRIECGGELFLRTCYEFPRPFNSAVVLARPDVWFHPNRPDYDEGMAECSIEEIQGPWNCIATLRHNFSNELQRIASLMGSPMISAAAAVLDGGNVVTAKNRLRMHARRDMPEEGHFTVIYAPMHPVTQECCLEWGMVRATATTVSPHIDPSRSCFTEHWHIRCVPNWALAMGSSYMQNCHHLNWIDSFVASSHFGEALGGSTSFVVLCLCKCVKGMPLLPCQNEGEVIAPDVYEFEPAGPDIVTLAPYLRTFLRRLGAGEEEIYESFEGLTLVRYMVAMQLGAWQRAWRALEEPFMQQKTAYRKLFGGTAAPVIKVGVKPKFAVRQDPLLPGPKPVRPQLAVRRTFLDFDVSSDADPRPLRKSNSDFGPLLPGLSGSRLWLSPNSVLDVEA